MLCSNSCRPTSVRARLRSAFSTYSVLIHVLHDMLPVRMGRDCEPSARAMPFTMPRARRTVHGSSVRAVCNTIRRPGKGRGQSSAKGAAAHG